MGWRRIRQFLNGDSLGAGPNHEMTYLSNLSTSQKLSIMANRGGGKKLTGRFGELVLFNGDPSIFWNQQYYSQIAEGYLAWKWGLQGNLPSYHPYKNSAP
jgi:hypothetical protein